MKKLKIFILAIFVGLAGCETFLDINEDPNNPTSPAIDQLLPGIMYDIGDDFAISFGSLGFVTGVYTHQVVTRQNFDQYGITGSDSEIGNYWKDLYQGPLMDLRVLIEMAEADGNMVYAGVAKLLKAYIYHMMVDLWGDIPYTEATTPGNVHPVFDDDQEIYINLLALIDEGLGNIQDTEAENIVVPGDDDLIYNGNTTKWVKFGNTLKLKIYTQARNTAVWNASAVNTLLADDGANLIGPGDDFMVPFGTSSAPENRHPGFVDEYIGAQISVYLSPWFYEILTGQAEHIFTGIEDPRVPYYWCNQLAGNSPENPPEYKDGDFNTIYFGSEGTNRDHAGRASFTMIGLYPVGGKYDDGTGGGPLGGSDGTGAAPQRLITYADRLYYEAELMQLGLISGDARAKLESAIAASLDMVNTVVDMVGPIQEVPYIGDSVITAYTNDILLLYDAAGTDDNKMEIIMTQKWIQGFGNNCDLYTDYRRTGYPRMFDPNSDETDGGPDGSGDVPTQSTREYPVSMPYDADEITLNNNAPNQKIITQDGIFWDVD